MSKILDFITTSPIPVWAADCRFTTLDDGANSTGPYGYECHQIHHDGAPVGWVYDTGTGYEWAGPHDSEPEPFTAAERGEG